MSSSGLHFLIQQASILLNQTTFRVTQLQADDAGSCPQSAPGPPGAADPIRQGIHCSYPFLSVRFFGWWSWYIMSENSEITMYVYIYIYIYIYTYIYVYIHIYIYTNHHRDVDFDQLDTQDTDNHRESMIPMVFSLILCHVHREMTLYPGWSWYVMNYHEWYNQAYWWLLQSYAHHSGMS